MVADTMMMSIQNFTKSEKGIRIAKKPKKS